MTTLLPNVLAILPAMCILAAKGAAVVAVGLGIAAVRERSEVSS